MDFKVGDIVCCTNIWTSTNNAYVGSYHIITDVTNRQMWPLDAELILHNGDTSLFESDSWFWPSELELVHRYEN